MKTKKNWCIWMLNWETKKHEKSSLAYDKRGAFRRAAKLNRKAGMATFAIPDESD